MHSIVKNTTLPNLLDLLAPQSCQYCGALGSVLCECCKKYIIATRSNLCPNCKAPNQTGLCSSCLNLPPTFVAGKRSEIIGNLIHDFKFCSKRCLAKPLAEIMSASLPQIKGRVIIVPLPTISRHIRERGFDHTRLIAKHLARLNSYEVEPLLVRAKNSVQVGADAKTRLKQAASAYSINPKVKIDQKSTYILFDDVWTTGASMLAALAKIRSLNINKIIISVLAVNKSN